MAKAAVLVCLGWGLMAPAADRAVVANWRSPHASLKNLDIDEVRWTGGFWGRWYEVNRNRILPTIWEAIESPQNGAQYASFLLATGQSQDTGGVKRLNWWSDGDVYKYVEALAAIYSVTKDPDLMKRMDQMIGTFAKAQEPDGYLSTPIGLKGAKRWQNLQNHELYNMGHLMTAANVHYRSTGKREFLDIAVRVADYLHTVFDARPPELAHFGFNPSNIMGAAELYRTTRNPKYLKLAGTFVNMRGSRPGGTDLNQTRVALRQETEAVGHAVTANYLYAGATDVYAETGERALLDAVERIWTGMATKKMYITGAVGSLYRGAGRHGENVHEAYGNSYELPLRLAYTETCANIANAMWNWRLLSLSGDPKYADIMELVLYNSMLGGVNVDGTGFYYNNPLRRHGEELPRVVRRQDPPLRSAILPCYCCPTNIARTIAELQGWAYSKSSEALWVHLYGANSMATEFQGGKLAIQQESEYPWDGAIRFRIEQAPGSEFGLRLRIPAWENGATIQVNGGAAQPGTAGSYAEVRRQWKAGDVVELRFSMAPRLVQANPYVETLVGQAAVMRGPVVYALESPDLPAGVGMMEVALPANMRLRPKMEPGLLGGVAVLEGTAYRIPQGDWTGLLYRTFRPAGKQTIEIRLIPFYAWANRGMSYMTVFMPVVY